MFIEIEKINGRNEKGVALVKLDTIVGACSQPDHYTRLYDENENLVSETKDENRYALFTNCGQVYIVEKGEYERVRDLLTK